MQHLALKPREIIKLTHLNVLAGGLSLIVICIYLATTQYSSTASYPPGKPHAQHIQTSPSGTPFDLDVLIREVTGNTPEESFELLRRLITDKPEVVPRCHNIAHELGHIFYRKYGDFTKAAKAQDDLCGSGYIHGVIEEKFGDIAERAIPDVVKTLCEPVQDSRCYHGVGHGLMFATKFDYKKSLRYCDLYPKDSDARVNCSDGVFMQYYGEGTLSYTTRISIGSPQKLETFCDEQAESYQFSCIYYAPRNFISHNPGKYSQLMTYCQELKNPIFRTTCLTGAGSMVMKLNLNQPQLAEAACVSTKNDQQHCIAGMLHYYNLHYGRDDRSLELCHKLTTAKDICIKSMEMSQLRQVSATRSFTHEP